MNKCCEKWKGLEHKDAEVCLRDGYAKEFFMTNQRFQYCPECGTKLDEGFSLHNHMKYGEWCKCEKPCGWGKYPGDRSKCSWCLNPIKPKKELPEKIDTSWKFIREDKSVQKINEIIDYLEK